MKKQLKTSKLVLDRETVTVLQSDALDAVNGGNAAAITVACSQLTTVISRVACTTTRTTTTTVA